MNFRVKRLLISEKNINSFLMLSNFLLWWCALYGIKKEFNAIAVVMGIVYTCGTIIIFYYWVQSKIPIKYSVEIAGLFKQLFEQTQAPGNLYFENVQKGMIKYSDSVIISMIEEQYRMNLERTKYFVNREEVKKLNFDIITSFSEKLEEHVKTTTKV